MSLPRPILPGTIYMVTRRCTQRQFLLKPSELTKEVFLYCLAFAARVSGVSVHAACALSNHYHAIVTDHEGRLPLFCEVLHKYVSKCLNTSYGRGENLWSTEQTSYVTLKDHEAVLAETVYALTNPVTAGLVSHGRNWPGVRLYRPGTRTVRRPTVFFSEDGPMPGRIALEIIPPPVAPGLAADEVLATVEEAVEAKESRTRAEFHQTRRRFLGKRAILAQRHTDAPRTREPRRKLSPRIACRNKWLRIDALKRLVDFVDRYRRALSEWRGGARDVIFPAGTYAMQLQHRVTCADT